jgi:hypothetical protein
MSIALYIGSDKKASDLFAKIFLAGGACSERDDDAMDFASLRWR